MFQFFSNIVKNIEVDVFFKNRLQIASLRIGKHRIVKNIASLRKVKIAHPYPVQQIQQFYKRYFLDAIFQKIRSQRRPMMDSSDREGVWVNITSLPLFNVFLKQS